MMIKKTFATSFLFFTVATAPVHSAPNGYFDLVPNELVTGDTWIQGGELYRLMGVQACLRGTFYTSASKTKQDCGIASMNGFAAFVKDTKPFCAVVTKTKNINYTMCYSTVNNNRIDLGMALITSGYAFAALNAHGMPYQPEYAVAENLAMENRRGLWSFKDVQHPAILLSSQAAKKKEKQ